MVKVALPSLVRLCMTVVTTLALAVGAATASDIVVNEIMVNEPGGRVSLEWFELYNGGRAPVALLSDTLSIDGQTVAVFGDVTIGPSEYAVIARNISAFEERWGDSSGIWGDEPLLENYIVAPLIFSLKNSAGTLTVFNDTALASLVWPAAGADGVSWERIGAGDDSVAQSTDLVGSTPGRMNSVTPLERDWEILSIEFVPASGISTRLDVTALNAGTLSLPDACLLIYTNPVMSATAPYGLLGDSLLCELLPALNPTDSVTISVFVPVAGVYDTVGITVAASDDRLSNNTQILTIPGADFPPLRINEFLPDPQAPLQSEWVEIKNISLLPVGIAGWELGDRLGFGRFDTGSAVRETVQPGDYLVLAQNPSDVALFYGLTMPPIAVMSWRTLNNSADIVRLRDPFGFIADSVEYNSVFGDNVSWSRSEDPETSGLWGRSALNGGTPNDSNLTLLNAGGSGLTVSLSPNPFSPDGDGLDETTRIDISAPDGGNMSVTIYDSQGRDVRHLFDGAPFSGNLTWDGANDSGRRVTIGVYIVYVEVENSASVKKTVVVAR